MYRIYHLKNLPRVTLSIFRHIDTAVGVTCIVNEDHQIDHVAAIGPGAELELAALDIERESLDVDLARTPAERIEIYQMDLARTPTERIEIYHMDLARTPTERIEIYQAISHEILKSE